MRFTIYTPGSTAGVPVNLVGSLQAPADPSDIETMRDEIEGFVSGLLGLVGIAADPLASREFILLANLIETSWSQGRSLDLATLVGQVLQPPLRKLGVFDLDTFFPPADRQAFALRLNGLLASPAFAAWAEGTPLDIATLLRSPDGKPCAAIVSIAHLSEDERQFVTSLLLSKVVTWMRKQSGTTDLRALVYMDEVAGYVPPTANPPTKKPIMTLMKQARAFGVGVVLATQNPVDLDYKAISNAGTWMVGRLQTERDKARLLEGMSAAAGTVDVGAVSDTISGLAKREFVLKRAGKDVPEIFTTRWAMSYLRGPLTARPDRHAHVRQRQPPAPPPPAGIDPAGTGRVRRPARPSAPDAPAARRPRRPPPRRGAGCPATARGPAALGADETPLLPEVAAGVPVRWLDPAAPWALPGRRRRREHPLPGRRRRPGAPALRRREGRPRPRRGVGGGAVPAHRRHRPRGRRWPSTTTTATSPTQAPPVATYVLPGAPLKNKTFWSGLQRGIVDTLVRNRTTDIFVNKTLKLYARVGEDQDTFTARCREAGDDLADAEAAKLRDKYRTKVAALEAKMAAAHEKASVSAAKIEAQQADQTTSLLGDVLGSFLGGRKRSRSIARTKSTAAESARLQSANQQLVGFQQDAAELTQELEQELGAIVPVGRQGRRRRGGADPAREGRRGRRRHRAGLAARRVSPID